MDSYIHIVFGDSARGVLRYFFKSNDSEYIGEVIGIQNDFSLGPIFEINSETGMKNRFEWLKNIYADVEGGEYLSHLEKTFFKELSSINSIIKNSKVILWHGENACDQAGIRYLTYLLRDKELFEVNVSVLSLCTADGINYQARSLGECSPDRICGLLSEIKIMNLERVQQLCEDFENLRASKANLRIFKDHKIIDVDESYYDDALLYNCSFAFQKTARVIGAAMGSVDQIISDTYLEYRVKKLIENGKLDYRGELLSMRDYEIKLQESI